MFLNNHGRHGLLSFLSSLPISVLRNLELDVDEFYDRANKLYNAALLTSCYYQHFLRPYIESEVNHKRHFITCWERADFLALLCMKFSCVFVTFPYGILGQVWYLIVSIPDLCLLPYHSLAL